MRISVQYSTMIVKSLNESVKFYIESLRFKKIGYIYVIYKFRILNI